MKPDRERLARVEVPRTEVEAGLEALRYLLNFADEATRVRTVMKAFTLPELVTTEERLERLYSIMTTAMLNAETINEQG